MVKKSENLWYAEWFDTKYYHKLYKHRDEKEAELFMRNITTHLGLKTESHILDLACGKGRHAQFLNTLGYKVTGLDLSENSILTARENKNNNLSFYVHDMREVYRREQLDAVFNLFTSFGYFDSQSDNLKVLTSISEMLKEDGVLVIDFMNAEKVINKLVAEEVKSLEGIEFHINRTYDGAHIFKNIQFNDNGEQFEFTERVQALTRTHFEELLEAAQFELLTVFGNYMLESFEEQKSDRLILIARKR
jgi:SAM-dependent methyltransferase